MKPNLYILFFFCIGFVSAQFNTITPAKAEDDYYMKVVEDTIKAKEITPKKKARLSKKDLMQEMDSLKSKIRELQNNNSINDSILRYFKLNAINKMLKREKALTESPLSVKSKIIQSLNSFVMPVDNFHITSKYGMRYHPIDKKHKMHNGIDLRANYCDVYSVLDGEVIAKGYGNNSGNYLKIRHSNSYVTIYAHLNSFLVDVGDYVSGGDVIAISGNSGGSTAPHLHFAVKEKGYYIDPIQFLNEIININNLIVNNYERK